MQEKALDFESNIGLVHFQAKRGFGMAQTAGVPLTYEDMFQEASLAFVLTSNAFKPELGYSFSAYFTRACYSQFDKAINRFTGVKRLNDTMKQEVAERKEENERRRAAGMPELPSMRYDVMASNFSDMQALRGDDDGAESYESSLMADTQSPEDIVETKQLMDQAMANLSPLATLIMDWLRDPPEQLLAELQSQRAHAVVAEAAGASTRGLDDGISLKNVKKFLTLMGQVSERELVLAEAELRRAVKYIEEAA